MVRGSPWAAGHAAGWNEAAKYSSALGIGMGRMASSLDPTVCRGADDVAIQCVATTLLVQVDLSKPHTLDRGGNSRDGRIYARQLGTTTLGARTITAAATCVFLP